MNESIPAASIPSAAAARKAKPWQRLLPFLITLGCFAYLYNRLSHAATAEGTGLVPYLLKSFENVSWGRWLALMIPYCFLYLFIDSKGAIALYLNRRDGVPGWEVGSSMLFLMFCEYYSLMLWATIGVTLQWNTIQPVFHVIPWIALGSAVFFVFFYLFFSGRIGSEMKLRERPILRAFRLAKVWHYAAVIAMRAPLVIAGVVVYTLALRLFGGSVSFGEMLGYLPVIFFGAAMPGPMHSVAILFWVLLFPDRPGQMTAFGFVMHNFFMIFNAGVGLLFLRRATREVFGRA